MHRVRGAPPASVDLVLVDSIKAPGVAGNGGWQVLEPEYRELSMRSESDDGMQIVQELEWSPVAPAETPPAAPAEERPPAAPAEARPPAAPAEAPPPAVPREVSLEEWLEGALGALLALLLAPSRCSTCCDRGDARGLVEARNAFRRYWHQPMSAKERAGLEQELRTLERAASHAALGLQRAIDVSFPARAQQLHEARREVDAWLAGRFRAVREALERWASEISRADAQLRELRHTAEAEAERLHAARDELLAVVGAAPGERTEQLGETARLQLCWAEQVAEAILEEHARFEARALAAFSDAARALEREARARVANLLAPAARSRTPIELPSPQLDEYVRVGEQQLRAQAMQTCLLIAHQLADELTSNSGSTVGSGRRTTLRCRSQAVERV